MLLSKKKRTHHNFPMSSELTENRKKLLCFNLDYMKYTTVLSVLDFFKAYFLLFPQKLTLFIPGSS